MLEIKVIRKANEQLITCAFNIITKNTKKTVLTTLEITSFLTTAATTYK